MCPLLTFPQILPFGKHLANTARALVPNATLRKVPLQSDYGVLACEKALYYLSVLSAYSAQTDVRVPNEELKLCANRSVVMGVAISAGIAAKTEKPQAGRMW